MAEGLFDGRYRYDYIYPRGRSGETLRAYDTQNAERPVVIKRPAPNDAPPIRAGQEVSILAERDALRRLSGHPVLTELLDEGHFIVGGTSHRYIVMERGEGVIIADEVFEQAERGERLPTLETLVILEGLLDLLQTAHSRDIVYNDVDAKHLFWNRDAYRLKVIDWGNAVFLEGDEITPGGVSKSADIYQTGELLYFILTGGGRAEVPRDAEPAWLANFGEHTEAVPPDLARITSRALHPNPRHRYPSIAELQRDLAAARRPHEAERNGVLARVNERLRRDRSKDELHDLRRTLQPALKMDPGYPATRDAQREIEARLSDLQISADLDAARIYLETANWRGAADILGELKGGARGETLAIIKLLYDWAVLMLEDETVETTPAIEQAIAEVFEGTWETAAHTLVMAATDATHRIHMRLAERVTSHMPDVVLLRPNLFRLGEALTNLDGTDGVRLTEQRELLSEIDAMLARAEATTDAVNMVALRDTYRGIVDRLSAMTTLMEAVNIGWGERRLPLSSLQRAQNAAMNLADNMHVIGKQAAGAPRDALAALDNSRAIDPTNPAWDGVRTLLDDLYRLLQSCQTYVPMADGSDLAGWLDRTARQIEPYRARLFDEMLIGMSDGVQQAATHWSDYDDRTVAGNRVGAVKLLAASSEAVGTVSPTLAGWFNQLRTVVNGADYVERHALTGGLGRALADGWMAFDSGRLADADRLAAQAAQIAKTDLQKSVVQRLQKLTEISRGWTERNGYIDPARTEAASEAVNNLYTEEENTVRRRFNAQMPSQETFLKAMSKGLVDVYGLHSTAAQRVLFADYVLQGAIDAHEGVFDNVMFWVEASERTLPGKGAKHPLLTTLHELAARRQDLLAVADAFNALGGPETVAGLADLRDEFEAGPRAKVISEAIHALREVENALPDWANAEFRAAGMKLDKAVKAAEEGGRAARIDLSGYVSWLRELSAAAARLHTAKRNLLESIEERPNEPTDALRELHQTLVDETTTHIGAEYTATLALWNDTYTAFAEVAASDRRRSAKLTGFNELFRAMFIDRHPAYPLYRHWFDLTERAPEFPAPPTDNPQPRITDEADLLPPNMDDLPEDNEAEADINAEPEPKPSRERPRRPGIPTVLLALVALAAITAVGIALSGGIGGGAPNIAVTVSPTPTADTTETALAVAQANELATVNAATSTPTPLPPETATANVLATENAVAERTLTALAAPPTATPTEADDSPTDAQPSETPPPSATPNPTNTATPSDTPTPADTATPTVPAAGLTGEIDLLALFERAVRENPEAVFWESVRFSQESGAWRLGVGTNTPERLLVMGPPPEFAVTYLGAGAPGRIQAVEATIALTTFNPALLAEDGEGVSFGMVLAPADSADPLTSGAGLDVTIVQPGIVNIGGRTGGEVEVSSQRSLNAVVARIRLERAEDGRVIAFFNGERLGVVGGNTSAGAPLLPALYVTDGGVIVSVTEWRVVLR